MVGTIGKNIENWFRNWYQKSHTILLKVIYLENKQWWERKDGSSISSSSVYFEV